MAEKISTLPTGQAKPNEQVPIAEMKGQDKQAVIENIVEEDACETLCAPETSQSVSKNLGTEDTPSSSKNAADNGIPEGKKNMTFASLFQDKPKS